MDIFRKLARIFVPKKPLGWLEIGQVGVELVFKAERSVPDAQAVLSALNSVEVVNFPKIPYPNYVFRDYPHLAGWLDAFLNVEGRELLNFCASGDKTFWVTVFKSSCLGQIDVSFKLMTYGLAGDTEYRISIVKVEDGEYVCIE
jgi:hypothetical protein